MSGIELCEEVRFMFVDRTDAGRQLAQQLVALGPWGDALVLGIPRGGVVVAAEIARALGLPLGVVQTAKVGAPSRPEYAIGAVAADGVVYPNPSSGFSADEVEADAGPAREKVAHELELFSAGQGPARASGRAVLLVDDGLATGLTALAAADYLRRSGATLVVLAVPVASRRAVERLKPEVDRVVVLQVPTEFAAVGQFYRSFGQTDDDEVLALLSAAEKRSVG
jgi:predicted phosphoribosyltransferase